MFPVCVFCLFFCLCFLSVFSLCVFSLCVFSVCVFSLCVFSVCVFSLCVFGLCVFALCFLSVFSICLFSLCVPSLCSLCVFCLCVLFVFSLCFLSLCFLSVCFLCVFSVCVFSLCVFSVCFLSAFSLCVFCLCVFSLCFLSVCFLSVFSLCVFSLCCLSVFSFCVFSLCFLSVFLSVFLIRLRLSPHCQKGYISKYKHWSHFAVVRACWWAITCRYKCYQRLVLWLQYKYQTLTLYFGLSGYPASSFFNGGLGLPGKLSTVIPHRGVGPRWWVRLSVFASWCLEGSVSEHLGLLKSHLLQIDSPNLQKGSLGRTWYRLTFMLKRKLVGRYTSHIDPMGNGEPIRNEVQRQ